MRSSVSPDELGALQSDYFSQAPKMLASALVEGVGD